MTDCFYLPLRQSDFTPNWIPEDPTTLQVTHAHTCKSSSNSCFKSYIVPKPTQILKTGMDFFPFFNIKNILSLYSIHTWIDLRKQRDSFKKMQC